MKMKKRQIGILTAAAVILLLVLIWAGGMVREYNRHTSVDKKQVTVVIEEGSTVGQMAKELKKAGVIRSTFLFRWKAAHSEHGPLQYGAFTLDTGWCLDDVVRVLATQGAQKESFAFLVPEGYSVEQICDKAVANEICTEEEFYQELDNGSFPYEFIKEIPADREVTHKLQGFLFPETYHFDSDTDAHILIDTMLAEFEKHYQNLKNIPSEYSFFDIITVASLVERESKLDSERATIAGVIYNRIREDMPLQIDASVVYACSQGKYDMDQVLYSDLEVDSPYNTYQNPGMPVGPICNPGIASIKAALLPEKHSYLYYHTDEVKQDGSHIFTETYEEHSATMSNGEEE